MMKRGSIFVILFVLAVAGILGLSQFLRSQPATEIILAVDPLIQTWAQAAIDALNNTQPLVNGTQRIQFKLNPVDDLSVWGTAGGLNWTPTQHPAAWLAASSVSVTYAREEGLNLANAAPSIARTPLVWGGYTSRIAAVTQRDSQPLDWVAVQQAAAQGVNGGFINLAFNQPTRKMSGLAALFTGAATFNQTTALGTGSLSSAARDWFKPVLESVPNFTTLGSDPAQALANAASVADIALLPEAQWLTNAAGLLAKGDTFTLRYPAYGFVLDFPLVRWNTDSTTPTEINAAVELLQTWLLSAEQQAALPAYGLRSATSDPTSADGLFAQAAALGVNLTLATDHAVSAPPRSEALGFVEWLRQQIG